MRKREQSVNWWNSLTLTGKWSLMHKHKDIILNWPQRYANQLTGREIESLWNKEGQPKPVMVIDK